ncbi:MAG TPA: shikimate kinase, partial [Gemmataceae bacterium]|nr:shikimate kinase [Gemmataceae bacterium]
MRIFLIGYRGTGKSTVARLLAAKLGFEAIDADHELERRAGKTIRRIFAEDGEPRFRDLESTQLAEFGQRENVVIATGGGVVLRPENRAILKAGRVVWLTASAAVLWRRMCGDESTRERRPDLAQGGLAEVEELLRVREPLYRECAEMTVDAELAPEAIVE